MQIELKPCPFCGDTPKEIVDATKILGVHRMIHRCAVIPPFSLEAATPEEVAAKWNRRALTSATPTEVARLAENIEALLGLKNPVPPIPNLARGLLEQAATALRLSAGGGEKGTEAQLADEILAELVRARTKFPGKNVTFAALVEEVGELATATFEESRDRVRKEAVQVAVMAMRMVLDGDHTFDDWRASKGLDALSASPTVEAGR